MKEQATRRVSSKGDNKRERQRRRKLAYIFRVNWREQSFTPILLTLMR